MSHFLQSEVDRKFPYLSFQWDKSFPIMYARALSWAFCGWGGEGTERSRNLCLFGDQQDAQSQQRRQARLVPEVPPR